MNEIAMSQAYMWSAVSLIVFFLIAVVIANMVPYRPNNPGNTTCRIWFWVCAFLTFIVAVVINNILAGAISIPSIHSQYIKATFLSSGLAFVVFVVGGIVVSKIFSNKKVGRWF